VEILLQGEGMADEDEQQMSLTLEAVSEIKRVLK